MDLDQVHLPDPITTDIQELQADNIRLHRQVKELKKSIKELKKGEKVQKSKNTRCHRGGTNNEII